MRVTVLRRSRTTIILVPKGYGLGFWVPYPPLSCFSYSGHEARDNTACTREAGIGGSLVQDQPEQLAKPRINKIKMGAGEAAQWLRALVSLPGQGSVSSTRVAHNHQQLQLRGIL